jgi:hypothetical protein
LLTFQSIINRRAKTAAQPDTIPIVLADCLGFGVGEWVGIGVGDGDGDGDGAGDGD